MSTLVVDELKNTLSQTITLDNTKRYSVEGIYPHLIVYGNPSGSFLFELIKGSTTVISKSYFATDIKNAIPTVDDYAHLYLPILPDNKTQIDGGDYTLKLTSSSYLFSESDYIGWCRSFESFDYVNDLGQNTSSELKYDIRIKIKEVI